VSKSQRTKGAAGEREWCEFLRKHGFKAQRLLGQARDGGDVPCPPVLWEVKRRKGIAVRIFLDQAVQSVLTYHSREECKLPAVAMREDGRSDWMVLLRAEDFIQLIKDARANDLLS
jgi:Holliday junction resolvase